MLRPNYENEHVREGALLRIAADLLVPYGELAAFDRFELVEWLSRVGIVPVVDGYAWWWVEDACPGPEPRDDVLILRRDAEWWIVGYWERGSFDVRHRFGNEGDACKWMLHHLVAHHATSMGTTKVPPHVTDGCREAILAVLDEVTALVHRGSSDE